MDSSKPAEGALDGLGHRETRALGVVRRPPPLRRLAQLHDEEIHFAPQTVHRTEVVACLSLAQLAIELLEAFAVRRACPSVQQRTRVAKPAPYRAGVSDGRQGGPLRRPGRTRCYQLDGVELLVRLPQELCEKPDAVPIAHANLETIERDGPVRTVPPEARATRPSRGVPAEVVDGLLRDVGTMSGATAERESCSPVVIDRGAAFRGVREGGQCRRGALVQPQPFDRSGGAVQD